MGILMRILMGILGVILMKIVIGILMGILMMDSMGWPYDSFDCLLLLYPYVGRDEGHRSNITLCLKEFPRAKPEGTPEGKGYIYISELSPSTVIISF